MQAAFDLVSLKRVAASMRLPEQTVVRMAEERGIVLSRINGSVLVNTSDVAKLKSEPAEAK